MIETKQETQVSNYIRFGERSKHSFAKAKKKQSEMKGKNEVMGKGRRGFSLLSY